MFQIETKTNTLNKEKQWGDWIAGKKSVFKK